MTMIKLYINDLSVTCWSNLCIILVQKIKMAFNSNWVDNNDLKIKSGNISGMYFMILSSRNIINSLNLSLEIKEIK